MDDDHSPNDYPIRGYADLEHARVVEALAEAIRTSYPEAVPSRASSESSDDEKFVMVKHSDVEDTASRANSESSVKEDDYPIRGYDDLEHARVVEALEDGVRTSYPEAAASRASSKSSDDEKFVMVEYSDCSQQDTASHKSTEGKLHREKETQSQDADPEKPREDAESYESMEDTLDKMEKNELRDREALASYDSTQLDYEALVGKLEPLHLEDFDRKPLPKNAASRTYGKFQPLDPDLEPLNKKGVRLVEFKDGKATFEKHLNKREDSDQEPFRKDSAYYKLGKIVSMGAELAKLNKTKENLLEKQEGAASYDDELLKIKQMRETIKSLFDEIEEKENKNPNEKEKKHYSKRDKEDHCF